jgi:crotonobetaine/carnitine-CoA ligase
MSQAHTDPRVPKREAVVFRDLITRFAVEKPDTVFAVFEDGTSWTFRDLKAEAVHAATGLAALGVAQGDHVASWQPNGPDAIRTWLGINWLGAVYVPFNTAYRGLLLEHVIRLSDAKLIVAHGDLLPFLQGIGRHMLVQAVALTDAAGCPEGLTLHGRDALLPGDRPDAGDDGPPLARPIEPWDTQSIIFTSGTTGPSKGVLSSYAQLAAMASAFRRFFRADDRAMMHLPIFHVAGMTPITRALVCGGSVAVLNRFRTDDFWPTVRRLGITTCTMMGSIASFLGKLPVTEVERQTPLRLVLLAPLNEETRGVAQRIGASWFSTFNMSEISSVLVTEADPAKNGTCGRPRPGVECRVVDANDCEVGPGEVGELVVRTDAPWELATGYHKNPEATAKAWRNGWFHTGDAFRVDADGDFFFLDRMKDSIRRRGENISSFEVEAEVNAHPDVQETAAIAVPSEHGEDEVMVVVQPQPGRTVDPRQLVEYLVPRMAHFMVPRFVRVMEALPKTETHKVQKHKLRDEGITGDTFDREAAGIRVRRQDLRQGA